jgi:hypothetical protein
MGRVKGIKPSSHPASLIALPKVATSVTSLSCSNLSGNNTGNKLATEWQHIGTGGWVCLPAGYRFFLQPVEIGKERRVRARGLQVFCVGLWSAAASLGRDKWGTMPKYEV